MSSPRITVLIDTYNHERFIGYAIQSVFDQDFPAEQVEILVVDDGSADATPSIVRGLGPRVRLISKGNGGQASAFNVGIGEARGEIIAFLDGDDWWAPAKLSRVMQHFDSHAGVGVIGHGIEQVNTVRGGSFLTVPQREREISLRSPEGGAAFRHAMCFFGTSRLAIRREAALRALPIPETIVIEADEFLAIVATAHSRAALIREPLTFYRLHDANHYQMHQTDDAKLRRMMQSIAALAVELPGRLTAAGVSAENIAALIDPLANNARRLRLRLDGGAPWETVQAERAERRFSYSRAPWAYRVYAFLSLAAAMLLPPRLYYRLRDWYGASALRRLRGIVGEPVAKSGIENISGTPVRAKL
jgi:glycosyltransferase involved in cell wall biosynthesis